MSSKSMACCCLFVPFSGAFFYIPLPLCTEDRLLLKRSVEDAEFRGVERARTDTGRDEELGENDLEGRDPSRSTSVSASLGIAEPPLMRGRVETKLPTGRFGVDLGRVLETAPTRPPPPRPFPARIRPPDLPPLPPPLSSPPPLRPPRSRSSGRARILDEYGSSGEEGGDGDDDNNDEEAEAIPAPLPLQWAIMLLLLTSSSNAKSSPSSSSLSFSSLVGSLPK
mmetsp:Transcript_18563/g.38192  ORF Transcript_18563/g.38192 Transcript_18563/m.38192 type:complete len:224 (+) Transcript_18563:123-794(+)